MKNKKDEKNVKKVKPSVNNTQKNNGSKKVKASNNKKSANINKKETAKKKKSNKFKLIIKILLIILLLMIIAGAVVVVLFFKKIVEDAPNFDSKNLYTQESSIVYSAAGNEIAKLGTEKREKITYDDLPQVLIDAIVATEDSTFFQHNGFNAARFLKASISQALGSGGGGASTLTMQVSKNAYTSSVSDGIEGIKRKFTDIYLSIFKIERAYTKEQIMEFYVNSYYMGGGAYGVEQACQNYFGKSVNNINLAEAAMLAGIYQAPGAYDPTIHPDKTEERRQIVLGLMLRHGYINDEEREIASKITVDKLLSTNSSDGSDQIDERYKDFVDSTVEDIKKKTGFDPYTTPMLIYTTMDEGKQEYVTNLMNGNNFNWENDKVQAGIAVIDNNNGAVVAVGAGRNREGANSWNYATMNRKHIGSTAKPLYDYGPLIEYNNSSTYHLYYDEPYTYSGGGKINNWDGGYKGLITMREALRVSRNIPALKAFQENSNANILDFVTKLGLSPEIEDGYVHEAHSIGAYGDAKTTGENPLSVAAAYSAFANGGYYTEPYTFTKIVYRNSDEVYDYKPKTTKVMSDATAYMVADMLVTTSGWATGTSSVNGITYGSKTGTSNYSTDIMNKYHLPSNAVNDLWVAGICRDYATAVWYGYDFLSSEYYNKGNGNTALYKQLIKGVFTGTPNFTKPSGVVRVTVEKDSPGNGLLPSEFTPDNMKVTELFKAGTEPTSVSTRFSRLKDVTNLKASLGSSDITLQWNAIATPDALNSDYLSKLYASTCRNVSGCVNTILGTNQSMFGNVNYLVYLKNSDGSLTQLHGTTNTKTTVSIPKNVGNTATFVVKASYTNYASLASNGVEVKVDISSALQEKISASLNGKDKVNATSYTDEFVKVLGGLDGKTDVTSKAKIEITVNNAKQTGKITLNTPGTYNIVYDISYKEFKKKLTRTVVIKDTNANNNNNGTNNTENSVNNNANSNNNNANINNEKKED